MTSAPDTKTERPWAASLARWNARHPVLALALISLLAVVINCHPVVFCGRSYVSPASFGPLVYSWWPAVPGGDPGPAIGAHGSDVGAMMLQSVPEGFIESRDLLQNGELPLWNRYNHAGEVFLAQAVTMLGDPLQLIVIFGHGSALAWDLKFLAAKFLFCLGFGLLVFRRFGSHPLALLYAALAAYCGAYYYINSHPVFFVFAYAPWILCSALALLDLRASHWFRWGLVWLLVNFASFNAGHVEVAAVLIGGLNLVALVYALLACSRASERVAVLWRMIAGTLLFLALTAPVWLAFLAALTGAYSVHTDAYVYQLPLRSLPGAFDDMFYQLLIPGPGYPAIAPGTSLLVLAGCILSVLHWRQAKNDLFFWVNLGAIGLWGGCIFGWVPGWFLLHTPLLNRDGHTYTDFSYLLVVHLTLQSVYGFRALAQNHDVRRAVRDFSGMALVVVGMMAGFCLGIDHLPVPWGYFICAATGAVGAPALFAFFNCRGRGVSAMGWTAILLLAFAAQFRFGLYGSGSKDLLLVGPRMQLDAPSPAIEKIRADPAGPFRVAGLRFHLFGDYAAVYGLEDLRSCEPLTGGEYMDLIRNFPGLNFSFQWTIEIQDPVAAHPLLNLLNVKYLLAGPGIVVQPGTGFRIAGRSDFAILENQEAWPRAFFTDQVVPLGDAGELVARLTNNSTRPFAALAPQEIDRQPGLRSLESARVPVIVAATHYQLRANSTGFEVHAPSAGVVCLSEAMARGFIATVNGEPQPVLRVNRAFKGVYLDRPGDYHILFTYRPPYWRPACGLFFTAVGIVAVLAALRIFRRWPRAGHMA